MDQATAIAKVTNCFSMPGQGRQAAILGTTQIYKLEAGQTGGKLACIEVTVPPGEGIPPHVHTSEDEVFYVLAGTLEFTGHDLDRPLRLQRGALFYGPRERLHGFRNVSTETALLLILLTPGENMQNMFAALATVTQRSGGLADPAAVGAACGRYGISFAAPD